jgi:ribosome maturation factor RimP
MDSESIVLLEKIKGTVEPILESEGMELIDLEHRKEGRGWVLRIFMDKPGGVNLDDCAEMSRQLGDLIEVEELIPHAYTLEVSSPGLDRPLKTEKDFLRSVGKLIQLSTNLPVEGRTFFKGILLEYQASANLRLADAKKISEIPASSVVKARLVFEG